MEDAIDLHHWKSGIRCGIKNQVYYGLCRIVGCTPNETAVQESSFNILCLFYHTGIVIPLCESGTCTLREAIIIGSILTKCSIPVLHSR